MTAKHDKYQHFYRMKAIDALALLEAAIVESSGNPSLKRPPGQDLRYYLLRLVKDDGPLCACDTKVINEFVDCYNSARHEPFPYFGSENLNHFINLLNAIRNSIKANNSPNRRISPKAKDTTAQMVYNGKTQVSLRQNKTELICNDETSV